MKINDILRFTLAVSAFGLFAASCEDTQLDEEGTSPKINVSAEIIPETKAALEQLGGSAQIKLYDILPTVSYEKRINGATASYGASEWPISGEPEGGYSWLKGGTGSDKTSKVDHHFFAWLTKDNAGLTDASLFGSALTLADSPTTPGVYSISVPETAILLTSSQFDFSYSSMVDRLAKDADYSKVNLTLNHFLASFNIRVHNYTNTPITVTSIQLYGLTNKKSGVITYNVGDGTVSTSYTAASSGSKTWTSASPASIFSGSQAINAESENRMLDTHLMWPQTEAELDQAFLVIKYKVGSDTDVKTTEPICLKPENADRGWDAGSRHELELAFRDKQFTLTVTAMPWDLYQPSIDYTGGISVKETGMMSFNDSFCTVDTENKKVYFKGGNPITIYFTIDAPLDATWQITKKGDWDYFELDNPVYTNYNDTEHDSNYGTIDGKRAIVTLYPNGKSGHREIQLSFSVRTNDQREINIDELIQGAKQYYAVDGAGQPTSELTTTVTPYPAPESLYYYTFVSE